MLTGKTQLLTFTGIVSTLIRQAVFTQLNVDLIDLAVSVIEPFEPFSFLFGTFYVVLRLLVPPCVRQVEDNILHIIVN